MKRPQRPYRLLRASVGTIVILAFTGIWVWKWFQGDQLSSLWTLTMIAIIFASGMAVFGKETFTSGVEEAQKVTKDSEEPEE